MTGRVTEKPGRFVVGAWHLETLPRVIGQVPVVDEAGEPVFEERWIPETSGFENPALRFATQQAAMRYIDSRPAVWDWHYTLDYLGTTFAVRIGYRHGPAWHHVDQTFPVETVN